MTLRTPRAIHALCALLFLLLSLPAAARGVPVLGDVALADLPVEAHRTLQLIKQGGPFPHRRDGVVFGNFEKRLPLRPRGYYREYTVPTPGERTRGARRIVAGGEAEYYYSSDHYQTFRRIRE